jgi:WD40 repeat protein
MRGTLLLALAGGPVACTKNGESASGASKSNTASATDEPSKSDNNANPGDTTDGKTTREQPDGGDATGGTMHRHNVFSAAASPAGGRLVTSSTSGEVIVWQTAPLRALHTLAPPAGIQRGKTRALAISPDGETIAIGVESQGEVERWRASDGKEATPLHAYTGRVTALAYHPAGDVLATAGADRAAGGGSSGDGLDDEVPALQPPVVRIWRGDQKALELPGLKGTVWAMAFDAGGDSIAAGGEDSVHVWSASTGHRTAEYHIPGQIAAITFVSKRVCVISSKLGRCFDPGAPDRPVEWPGVKAPTTAAYIDQSWIVSGTYEALEVRSFDKPDTVVTSIPDRVYSVIPVGKDIWAIFKDRAVVLRDGKPTGAEHELKQ